MRLKSLQIVNFRCITHSQIDFESLTSFVGPNNSGKSTILKAIYKLLDPKSGFDKFDLAAKYQGEQIRLQGVFDNLTPVELDVFADFLIQHDTISIRAEALVTNTGELGLTERKIVSHRWTDHWFLNPEADLRLTSAEKVRAELDLARDPLLKMFLESNVRKGRSKAEINEFQASWRRQNTTVDETPREEWQALPKSGPLLGHLPEVQFLPAELTIEDDASLKSGSLFHRLTRLLMANMEGQFGLVQASLDQAIESLAEGDTAPIRREYEHAISSELREWGTTASIAIVPPDAKSIMEKCFELKLDDGVTSSANRKGHGLQRATFFALTRALARIQQDAGSLINQHRSLFLLVEEPELYLHPQAQRRLRHSLEQLAGSENTQVIIATHSTHFLSFSRAYEIRRITKSKNGARRVCFISQEALKTLLPKKQNHNMDYWLNPHRNEIFFADIVLLVEGQTESTIIPTICEIMGEDTSTLSAIDAGGKGNLLQFIKVLNSFDIPYLVIHDEDPLLQNESSYSNEEALRRDKATFALNQAIKEAIKPNLGIQYIVRPEFEPMFGVPKATARRLGKGLAAQERLDEYLSVFPLELPSEIHDILVSLRKVKAIAEESVGD